MCNYKTTGTIVVPCVKPLDAEIAVTTPLLCIIEILLSRGLETIYEVSFSAVLQQNFLTRYQNIL